MTLEGFLEFTVIGRGAYMAPALLLAWAAICLAVENRRLRRELRCARQE